MSHIRGEMSLKLLNLLQLLWLSSGIKTKQLLDSIGLDTSKKGTSLQTAYISILPIIVHYQHDLFRTI